MKLLDIIRDKNLLAEEKKPVGKKLYHFTTQTGFQSIVKSGRLHASVPKTVADKEINRAVGEQVESLYCSFTANGSFTDPGYAKNRNERSDGSKLTIKLIFDELELEKVGNLKKVGNYLEHINEKYLQSNASKSFVKWLKSRGVTGKRDAADLAAKNRISEQEYRLFTGNENYLDISKLNVAYEDIYGNEDNLDFKEGFAPQEDIWVEGSNVDKVANIAAVLLMYEIEIANENIKGRQEILANRKDLQNKIEDKKKEQKKKVAEVVKSYSPTEKLKKALKEFLSSDMVDKYWDRSGASSHTFEVLIRSAVRSQGNELQLNKLEDIFRKYKNREDSLRKQINSLNQKYGNDIEDLEQNLSSANEERISDEKVRSELSKNLPSLTGDSLDRVIEATSERLIDWMDSSKFLENSKTIKQSFDYLTGLRGSLNGSARGLVNELHRWITEVSNRLTKEWGTPVNGYTGILSFKRNMSECKSTSLYTLIMGK